MKNLNISLALVIEYDAVLIGRSGRNCEWSGETAGSLSGKADARQPNQT